jgi:hypothetical protein
MGSVQRLFSGRARQPGNGRKCLDPTHRSRPQRGGGFCTGGAQRQSFEKASSVAVLIKLCQVSGDPLHPKVECDIGSQGGKQLCCELSTHRRGYFLSHLLFPARESMVQTGLLQTCRHGDVGHRRSIKTLVTKQPRQTCDELSVGNEARRHTTSVPFVRYNVNLRLCKGSRSLGMALVGRSQVVADRLLLTPPSRRQTS